MKEYNFKYTLVSLLVAIMICGGCQQLELNPDKFYRNDFPMAAGSYWEYKRTDSIFNILDTVRVTAVASDVEIGDKKGLWQLDWTDKQGEVFWTEYAKFGQRSITYFSYSRNIDKLTQRLSYKFPFEVDDEWSDRSLGEVSTVLADQVPSSDYGKDFGEGYYIFRDKANRGFFETDSTLVVEDVGIVWWCRRIEPALVQTYHLLDFHHPED